MFLATSRIQKPPPRRSTAKASLSWLATKDPSTEGVWITIHDRIKEKIKAKDTQVALGKLKDVLSSSSKNRRAIPDDYLGNDLSFGCVILKPRIQFTKEGEDKILY